MSFDEYSPIEQYVYKIMFFRMFSAETNKYINKFFLCSMVIDIARGVVPEMWKQSIFVSIIIDLGTIFMYFFEDHDEDD